MLAGASLISSGGSVVAGELEVDVGGVESVGEFAVDAEEDEDDVAGLWRLEVKESSKLSLPITSGEEGLSGGIGGVE